MTNTILLTCAGRRVELLEMLRTASGATIVAVDVDPTAPALYHADAAFRSPVISDEFVDYLLDLSQTVGASLIVPTTDRELPRLADARDRFEARGIRIAVADAQGVRKALDKLAAAECLLDGGVAPVPTATWTDEPPMFTFPLVVKPRQGAASEGVRVLQDVSEWTGPPRRGSWIVQPLMNHPEFTVDAVADESGSILALGARERLKVRGGEVERARTVRATHLVETATQLTKMFALSGPFNFQLFVTAQGPTISEINPRFGGGAPLSQRAGAQLAECLCHWGFTGRWPDGEVSLAQPGVYMSRYDRSQLMSGDELLW